MAQRLIWVRLTKRVFHGDTPLTPGTTLEVTREEFRTLVAEGAAVPCGERGRTLTADYITTVQPEENRV